MLPGFKKHELAARYDVQWFSEDEWHAHSGERTSMILSTHVISRPDLPRVLLNAGSGVYALRLPQWTEMAVDLFAKPIHGRGHAIQGDIHNLQFSTGSFGAIVCVGEVLGYCDPVKVISEFSRVIAPHGILVCDFGSTRSYQRWFSGLFGDAAALVVDEYNQTPEPIWIYDPQYIMSLLRSAGFEIQAVIGSHTWSALGRRLGLSSRSSIALQRKLSGIPLPFAWSDVITVVASRSEAAIKRP